MWCLMITLPQPHNQPVTHHLHNRQTCLLTIGSTSLMVIPTSLIISDWPLNGVLHTAMSQKIWHCPLPVKQRGDTAVSEGEPTAPREDATVLIPLYNLRGRV
jgi:hypothetical protein